MAVVIRAADGTPEWVLLELQGILKFKMSKLGVKLGSLCVKEGKAPTLRIGDHVLKGKMVDLKKPLAAIQDSGETEPYGGTALQSAVHKVKGVIRKKIIFEGRPEVDPLPEQLEPEAEVDPLKPEKLDVPEKPESNGKAASPDAKAEPDAELSPDKAAQPAAQPAAPASEPAAKRPRLGEPQPEVALPPT
jgi:chromosome transmission fidelity protein 8